ncbi:MAG: FG-GAP repeat protein [Alphaproteobacteria bacterium]|nr:FG-GAP repeat protein [Alphaproteobacteria bacterium]
MLSLLVVACVSPELAEIGVGPAAMRLPGTTWELEGPNDFGVAVASAGDVDGDGFADVLVGVPTYNPNPGYQASSTGAAVLFAGSPSGLESLPSWTAVDSTGATRFGDALAGVGDVDGDGYDDVIVGAPYWRNGESDEGAIFLYLGAPGGLSPVVAWSHESNVVDASLGFAVSGAGDVNGDGYADVVVGAPFYGEGAVHLFVGGPAGLSLAWTVTGNQLGMSLGMSVSGAGDVNGDGYDDLLVGAPNYRDRVTSEGAALLFLGGATGPSTVPDWAVAGDTPQLQLGGNVAGGGDVNGDGYDDVVVATNGEGRVAVYVGGPAGLSANPIWTAGFPAPEVWVGPRVALAQDLDGDGYDDVVVGAWYEDGAFVGEGAAHVYFGGSSGPSADPDWSGRGGGRDVKFGAAVAGVGDVDGDGRNELLVGGYGSAYLFPSFVDTDGDGWLDAADVCPSVADPAQADTDGDAIGDACDAPSIELRGRVVAGTDATLVAGGVVAGESVRFLGAFGPGGQGPCAAGICLALGPSATLLGTAVADPNGTAVLVTPVPAGLVPGGPYVVQALVVRGAGGQDSVVSEVLTIGADRIDWDGDGLVDAQETVRGTDVRSPDTDGDGMDDGAEAISGNDPLNADTDGDGVLDGADACWFRDDLIDLDSDGIADGCDRCPSMSDPLQLDTDEDGVGDVCEVWTLSDTTWLVTGVLPNYAGDTVLALGDVNGDGYDDVLVTAGLGLTDEVDVFFGSPSGPGSIPDWTVFGSGVASAAGDVNGDGYADVLMSGEGWSGPLGDGVVALYLGSPGGLPPTPSWTAWGDHRRARFGASCVGGMDLNGDGYDDIAVGAPDYDQSDEDVGLVEVFFGGPAGPSATADQRVFGSAAGAHLGYGLLDAGDVNGDGYGDLLMNAQVYGGTTFGLSTHPMSGRSFHAGVGDLNGDGYSDLLRQSYLPDGRWVASVHRGAPGGPDDVAVWSVTSDQIVDSLGDASTAGDLDGDGFDDLVLGASSYDGAWPDRDAGAVYVYLGGPHGLPAEPAWTALGPEAGARFGSGVSVADVDGDGLGDLLVGAPNEGFNNAGEVHLYLGRQR